MPAEDDDPTEAMSVLTIVNKPYFPEALNEDDEERLTEPLLSLTDPNSPRLSRLGGNEYKSLSEFTPKPTISAEQRRQKRKCKKQLKLCLILLTSLMSVVLFLLLIKNAVSIVN